jgi:hypothetical protein
MNIFKNIKKLSSSRVMRLKRQRFVRKVGGLIRPLRFLILVRRNQVACFLIKHDSNGSALKNKADPNHRGKYHRMLSAVGSAKWVPGAIPPLLLIHVAPLGVGVADISFHLNAYLIKSHGCTKLNRVP